MSVSIIINPIAGGRADAVGRRVELARRVAADCGEAADVSVTERPGDVRARARAAREHGARLIVAWGGDGTVNEVASEVAFTDVPMAIVPSGSGNGLARELKIPFDAAAALDVAWTGRDRVIDAGEVDGRLFFNLAGIGFDAHVAHRFAAGGLGRRGFSRYLEMMLRELATYQPEQLTITIGSSSVTTSALLVAIANGRQYGNGALVAPRAQLDDGRLDVIVIAHRPALRAMCQIPLVFIGRIADVPGVTMQAVEAVTISSPSPLLYHLDGEPIAGMLTVSARSRPRALKIKVPAQR